MAWAGPGGCDDHCARQRAALAPQPGRCRAHRRTPPRRVAGRPRRADPVDLARLAGAAARLPAVTLICVPVQVRGWRTARNLARLPSGVAGGWPAAETAGTPGDEAMLTLAEPIGTGLLPGGYPAPPRHSLRRLRGGSISCWTCAGAPPRPAAGTPGSRDRRRADHPALRRLRTAPPRSRPRRRPGGPTGGHAPLRPVTSGRFARGVEPGGPDALAVEGFGWSGGDLGCPGQDLGKQVQQLCPFAGGQGGQDAPLDGADPGEQLVGGGAAVGGDLDQDAAPVARVGDAADPAAVFEQVERGRHGGRGDQDPVADL